MIIATVSTGYADGYNRSLSNIGFVFVNNMRAKIIGRVCMDQFMIDVTNIPNVKVGTNVYIWDNKIITLNDIATICNTITYEIICGISDRVRRIFK